MTKIEENMKEENRAFLPKLVGWISSLYCKQRNKRSNKNYKHFPKIFPNKSIDFNPFYPIRHNLRVNILYYI